MSAQAFGKYTLLKKLATGGMAEVWLARQSGIKGFERLLVVKRILPHLADDPEFVQMFLNEAKIVARFSHPNIAQIYDLGDASGTYFIAMEFVHGEDLGRVMRKAWSSGQWIARPLSIRIVAGACEGLFYAHTRQDEQGRPLKVVHRDISPQNILISFDGSVKLVDFGIAKAADQHSMTKSGAIKGKFAYMSPEQAAGKPLDHRSDVFSIGLVLYELLTGVRPLKRDTDLATLQAALECSIEPPSKVADVPSDLDPVVMRALAKTADDRYRDARTFQMALEELLVSQRWVASSVQLSELMHALFSERLAEEAKLGHPEPRGAESSAQNPAVNVPPGEVTDSNSGAGKDRQHTAADESWDAPPGEADQPVRRRAGAPRTGANPRLRPADAEEPKLTTPGKKKKGEEARPPPPRPSASVSQLLPDVEEPPPADSLAPRKPGQLVIPGDDPGARKTDERPPASGRMKKLKAPARTGASPPVRALAAGVTLPPDSHVVPLPPEPPSEPKRPSPQVEAVDIVPQVAPKPAPSAPRRPVEAMFEPEVSAKQPLTRVRLALFGASAVLVIILSVAFKGSIASAWREHAGPLGIYLTVNSDQPVHVSVRHHPGEKVPEPVTDLGQVPLYHEPGAHLRDTVILSLPEQDIYWEKELPFGEPGEDRSIQKKFERGNVILNLRPDTLRELVIKLHDPTGPVIAHYPPAQLNLFEGKHTLIIEGEQLLRRAQIEVEVKPNGTTQAPLYDLTQYLRP